MRAMKYHPHGSVLFVTFSVEEGLLLLSNPLCQIIIKSCLAAAQQKYPVIISHFIVQATHVHLIMVVDNPDDISGFVRYFKTESAHMLNRILGRKKRTIWCEGYDSPIVLSPVRAILAIAYIYANPVKDNLVNTIEEFPGLSSWSMYHGDIQTQTWKIVKRSDFRPLSQSAHRYRGYELEANSIIQDTAKTATFTIKPNAWMNAFGINSTEEYQNINKRIIQHIRHIEERARIQRVKQKKPLMGRERLLNQRIDPFYLPKRNGKKMWCLAENRLKRLPFIKFLKGLFVKARLISKKWTLGDFSEPYPLGLYPPPLPKLAEPIFGW
jgi:REP element-mobilizing transposase RayT